MIILLASSALAQSCPDAPTVARRGDEITITFCAAVKTGCEEGCWAGATVRRASDAFHHDFEPVRLEAADLARPITVKGKPGADAVEFVIGVWADQYACGEDARHGCQAWGTLLGDELWTFPEDAYGWTYADFTDIAPRRISVLDAGGGPTLTSSVRALLEDKARLVQAEGLVDGGKANNPRAEIEVMYRGLWHRPQAWALAASLRDAKLGYRWTVKHWPEAPEAFVVAVGGE